MKALFTLGLLLAAVTVVPGASAIPDCLFGYNPDALANVCYDVQEESRPLYTYTVTTTDGICVIGNLCPGVESTYSGEYLYVVASVYVEATFLCDNPKFTRCGWTVSNDPDVTAE